MEFIEIQKTNPNLMIFKRAVGRSEKPQVVRSNVVDIICSPRPVKEIGLTDLPKYGPILHKDFRFCRISRVFLLLKSVEFRTTQLKRVHYRIRYAHFLSQKLSLGRPTTKGKGTFGIMIRLRQILRRLTHNRLSRNIQGYKYGFTRM